MIGTEGTGLLREMRVTGDPACGKRVTGQESNGHIVQLINIDKFDFHRVCLQSDLSSS